MFPTIRRARAEDIREALAISNAVAATTAINLAIEPETFADWKASFEATSAMYPWFVGVDAGDRVVGFAKASPWKGRCAYAFTTEVTIYIADGHRGRGLGRALYETIFPILRAQGYRTLIAGITLPNAASEHLHESFGMHRVALYERVGWKFERWHDVGFWQLHWSEGAPGAVSSVDEALQRGDNAAAPEG